MARAEHASVASFARFVEDAMRLGAPPDILASAASAMADEVTHAQLAFGVASRLLDRPVGVGEFATPADARRVTPEAIVVAAIREGCIGETAAALQAAEARDRTLDPEIRSILGTIADDESRHAALAWRFVHWAWEAHPELRPVIRRELCAPIEWGDARPHPMQQALGEWGVLDRSSEIEIARRAVITVIRPCADSLLGSS